MKSIPWLSPVFLAAFAAPALAQWAATPHEPQGELVAGSELLLHRTQADWRAFTSGGRRWWSALGADADLIGAGDRVALWEDGTGQHALSAFRDSVAALAGPSNLLAAWGGDVAVVVRSEGAGPLIHAFSGFTGQWSSLPLVDGIPEPNEVAVSDGVVLVRDGARYLGFAARTGTWAVLSTPNGEPGDLPFARGEVGLAPLRQLGGGGVDRMAAFSGVLGVWDISGLLHFSSSTHIGTHVALVRVQHPVLSRFFACGFSAYTGRWVVDTAHVHTPSVVVQYGGETIVALESLTTAFNLTSFSARPGTWSVLAGSRIVLGADGDTVIAEDPATGSLVGASGFRPGWFLASSVGPHGWAPGTTHFGFALNGDLRLRTFSPATAQWSNQVDVSDFSLGRDVAGVVDGFGQAWGWSARGGNWVAGPTLAGGSTALSFGSVLAWVDAASQELWIFDGRFAEFRTGPRTSGAPLLTAGDGVLLVQDSAAPGLVHGYSPRRGDVSLPPGGPLALPLALGPQVVGEVGWLVDASGQLWAFGAGRDAELAHSWPEGPSTHGPQPAVGGPVVARVALSGAPGEVALLFGAPGALSAGIPLAPLGGVAQLPLGTELFLDVRLLGPSGREQSVLPLPAALPPATRLWLQPVLVDPLVGSARFGAGVGDAWVF